MVRIIGIIAIVVLGLLGLNLLASKGGHEAYDPRYFRPGPVIGLMKGLSADELEGRDIDTAGSRRAQEMIEARLQAMNLLKIGNSYRQPFSGTISAGDDRPERHVEGVNLVGVVQGQGDSDKVIVITAHYDHIGMDDEGRIYNGADDNASGVAAVFAIADYFSRKDSAPRHSLVLAFVDGEEWGSLGAEAFIEDGSLASESMAFNLNLDMVSRADNGKLWASGVSRTPSLRSVLEEVSRSAPLDLDIGFDGANPDQDDWTLMSDHRSFLAVGIPHLYLGVEDHPDYHQPTDDFANVDQDTFLKSVDTIIAVTRAIDENLEDILAGFDPDWKPVMRDHAGSEPASTEP